MITIRARNLIRTRKKNTQGKGDHELLSSHGLSVYASFSNSLPTSNNYLLFQTFEQNLKKEGKKEKEKKKAEVKLEISRPDFSTFSSQIPKPFSGPSKSMSSEQGSASADCHVKGVLTHGGRYVRYNVYGNLFEVSTKYVPPLRPVGRGASGIVWYDLDSL